MKTNSTGTRQRLLVLTSTFPRWADDTEPSFVFDLCRRLATEYEVTVLAPHARDARRQETLSGVRVIRYRYGPTAWERLAYEGGIMANLKRRPWQLCMLPIFFLAMLLRLLQLLRELRPDAVHAHWIVPQGVVLAAAIPQSGRRPRTICTAHGSDVSALRGRFWRGLRRYVANRLDGIVVVSDPIRDWLVTEGCPPGKIDVIPMGVDLTVTFTPQAQVRSPHEILFVGRLVYGKGADVLLEAMPCILARHPEATLTLVGDGPEKVSLHDTVLRLGLGERVRFVGALSHASLPQHYRGAALLVLPSREEGFGLVLVEAMGCGCPVAASDLPAVRVLLEDGACGGLFRPGDSDDLARVVCELLADPQLVLKQADETRRRMLQRYDWQEVVWRYSEALLPAHSGELHA